MFTLLLLYQLKHFLCDYIFQGLYMLGKFKPFPDFIRPLLAHSGVHGVATFLIALAYNPRIAFWVAMLDTVAHFTIDRVKASPKMLGRYKALSGMEYQALFGKFPQKFYQNISGDWGLRNATGEYQKEAITSNTYFWWSLGFDQGLHHLTHYLIIYLLLK